MTKKSEVKKDEPKKETSVKLVKMKLGDIEADVHPEMVEDYAKGGYVKL